MRIKDPRTGELAYVHDEDGYLREIGAIDAECPHERHELRRFQNKNGAFAVMEQCFVCGERVGNPVKAANRESMPLADMAIRDTYRAKWKADRTALVIKYIDQSNARDAKFWKDYDAYLLTPEWKARRAKVLKRCGEICEGCRDQRATVVHHLTYDHVFDELLFELVGLCEPCHAKAHVAPPANEDENIELDSEIDF